MAVTVTIDTPTVVAGESNMNTISVVAHYVDGATALGEVTHSLSYWDTSTAGRAAIVDELAKQINARKIALTRQQLHTTAMGAVKTALEAKI
jgi:hypothetical protein